MQEIMFRVPTNIIFPWLNHKHSNEMNEMIASIVGALHIALLIITFFFCCPSFLQYSVANIAFFSRKF